MSLLSGFFGLQKDINKVRDEDANKEGIVSDLTPELELSMDDEELVDLAKQWKKNWEPYQSQISKLQTDNENYWLGQQFRAGEAKKSLVDNLIFEALETFLPIATRPRADPTVESDGTEEGKVLADRVRKMLIHITDTLSYNLILKQTARYWALYLLGAIKVGWSEKSKELSCVAVRPQKLILDPQATIEQGEYTGYYIGEYLKDTAGDLIKRFPAKSTVIKEKAKNKLGTTLSYIQWWTDEYLFWALEDEVLAKSKNPHWNYDTKQQSPVDEMGNVPADPATGLPQQITVRGKNHFAFPQKPYRFLSVFNLGKQPHDETNLIQQNLPLQDLVNKRLEQIDKNADNTNNGLALSGDAFTEEQAKKAASARRKGGALWVPTGKISDAVQDLPSVPLPNFLYESLIDYRNEIRNIFGTRGSTPQGAINEQTVRGKMMIKGADTDRTGGGISTYLEQLSDGVLNWFVQLMYVYYDEPHTASVIGRERATEYISLINSDFTTKLLVGVKDGSMIPHDPASERNEAVELMTTGNLDPITFFDKLEFPNPREAAKNLFLWKADPIQLFPDLVQAQQQAQMQQQQQQQAQMGQQQQGEIRKEKQKSDARLQEISLKGLVTGLVQKAKPKANGT